MKRFLTLSSKTGKRFCSNQGFHITGTFGTSRIPRVGEYAEMTHAFSQKAVNDFALICGDNNPLHTNPEIAKDSMFGGTIVHGILSTSLFSGLFGRSLAGSIYVNQTLKFKAPVHVGVPIKARIEVIRSEDRKKGILITCSTTCQLNDGKMAVEGEAQVLVPK